MKYTSSDDLNKATARIYITETNDDSIASGFFITFTGQDSIYLVTNRHAAENAKAFTISLHSSLNEPCHAYIDNISEKAIFHPQPNVDLCIVKMANYIIVPSEATMKEIQIKSLLEKMIMTENEVNNLNYCEEIMMFGSPHGIYDLKNNLSIALKGMTATHARCHYGDSIQFMVDIPSYLGSSGSAIYLCTQETMSSFDKTKLLGIFFQAQYDPKYPNDDRYIHLGKAIPAYKLLDFKNLL